MAYFLGYKENDKYIPIDLGTTDILEIIKYTSSFNNKEQLLNNLNIKLKPETELCYLISEGKRLNKDKNHPIYGEYKKLPFNDIYYYDKKNYFNIDGIKEFLINNKDNDLFIESLYSVQIKKIYSSKLNHDINKIVIDLNQSMSYFNSIYRLNISDDLKKYLKKFGEFYSLNRRNNNFFYTESYLEYINEFIKLINQNDHDLCIVFDFMRNNLNYYKNPDIPLIKALSNLYNNRSEANVMETLNEIVYIHERDDNTKTRIIKIENDHLKMNKRGICDIGSLISGYITYLESLQTFDYDREEKEEFLTEDDYTLMEKNKEFYKKR